MASKPAPKKAPPKASKTPAAPKEAAGAAVPADWERIELEYRAGIKTLRQIAGEHGISEGAIRKRAKRDEWTRDLSERIQDKAEQLVRKEAVRNAVRNETAITERQVIDANAQAVADIRIAHRKDIRRARTITNALLDELEQQTDPATLEMLRQLGDLLRSEDDNGNDRRNDLYQKVISLSERSKTMKTLADSLRVVVDLERAAFGMDKDTGTTAIDTLAECLKEITSGTNSSFKPVARDPERDEDE